MNNKHYVGNNVRQFQNRGKSPAVSQVVLYVDDENCYVAPPNPDKDGYVVEAFCPSATQAMVDALFAQLHGLRYQGYTASAASISPEVELGDGITAKATYGMVAEISTSFGPDGISDLGAPSEDFLNKKYQFQSETKRNINRKIAETRALITKTSEEIRLEVFKEIDGIEVAFSELELTVDGLRTRVQDVEGNISSLEQTAQGFEISIRDLEGDYAWITATIDGLTVSGPDGTTYIRDNAIQTGSITADKIDATNLKVSAANITGTLSASQINLTGAIEFTDLSVNVNNSISGIQQLSVNAYNKAHTAESTVNGWTYAGTTYIDGTKILTGTVTASYLRGGSISLLNALGSTSGTITLSAATSGSYAVDIQSYAAMRIFANSGDMWIEADSTTSSYLWIRGTTAAPTITCHATFRPSEAGIGTHTLGDSYHKWGSVYSVDGVIQTSDRNAKHDVIDIPDEYVDLFMGLRPRLYKYDSGTSDRYHVGYVAQEVEQAMLAAGISSKNFAALVIDYDEDGNKIYMLRYEEFMALHTMMIQRLVNKVG